MRNSKLTTIVLIVIFLASSYRASAIIPPSYQFNDSQNDAVYWKYSAETNHVDPENRSLHPGLEFAEIVSAGYQLDRSTQQIILNVETLGIPVINQTNYMRMEIDLENSTSKIGIRVQYSALGGLVTESMNQSVKDIFYQANQDSPQGEDGVIETHVSGHRTYWVVNSDLVDIIRIFDDPNMLLTLVRVELEYSLGGSSSFGGGDYIRDILQVTTFDFSGAAQTQGNGFFDIVNPFAIGLYFGIPLLYVIRRRFKNN